MSKITCFGEVLLDKFSTSEKIGGAPLNVATRLSSFNHSVSIISAVGKDERGEKLIDYLEENKINSECVQILENYETGVVNVLLNEKGSALYDIKYPCAWDKIVITKTSKDIVKNTDFFVFGSLVARDETSKATLYELIELANYKVFDINLRSPHYNYEILLYLMQKADFIKFNDDELHEVSRYLGSKYNSLEQNLTFIAEKTNTKHICVTRGANGAILFYEDKLYFNDGYLVNVIDTVGAGDSFLGALISQLLNKEKPQLAIDFACVVGALVTQTEGANPKISKMAINEFLTSFEVK